MATCKLNISKKIVDGKSEVFVRFSYSRIGVFRLKTGISVPVDAWNDKAGKLIIPRLHTKNQVMLSNLQVQLNEIVQTLLKTVIKVKGNETREYWESIIENCMSEHLLKEGVTIKKVQTKKAVEKVLKAQKGNSVDEAFKDFVEQKSKNEMRRKQLLVTKNILLRYNSYINKVLTLEEWNNDHLCNLERFLQIEYTFFDKNGKCLKRWKHIYDNAPIGRIPQQRGGNAIHSIMKRIRTFFNWCALVGKIPASPFKQHPLKECVYGTPYYLTSDEIKELYNYDFSDNPRLGVQRDIFVLQSNLGMRIGDFYCLTKNNIVNGAIEYIPSKTLNKFGKVARIPLTKTAKEVIAKYSEILKDHESIVPLISEQHYNKAIKEMLRIAGINRVVTTLNTKTRKEEKHPIWEVASSHMARRNFIGNLYANVKDPDLISSMTGHVEGSKAFSRYRAIDDRLKKEVLAALE